MVGRVKSDRLLAELNLAAGMRAKAATAYASALLIYPLIFYKQNR
jgi:predicted ATPase